MRPTKSLGLYLQQVGRGLRPAPGKTHLTVLDHAGNTLRHGPPEMPRAWSLEGRPKKAKKADEDVPPARQCTECFAVHAPSPQCPECGHVYPVASREIEHVEGDLADITDSLTARFGKHIPLREVLKGARDEDLAAIARARGYRPGWVHHIRQARRAGVAA